MSRPTNKRPADDALMLKAEIMNHYRHGKALYDTFAGHMRARHVQYPDWASQTDTNVLNAVKEAHTFWSAHPHRTDVIVGAYMRDFTGAIHHAKFQNLVGKNKMRILETIRRDQVSACAAMHMSNAARIITAADKECQDLNLEATVETELDYVRGVLKGQTGSRLYSAAGCVFLAGVMGSIPAWVRCFMSNNDPAVLRNHGADACSDHMMNPPLRMYLMQRYNYDSTPVLAMKAA